MKKSFAMLLLSACGGGAVPGTPSSGTPATQSPVTGRPPEMLPLKGAIEETVLIDQDGVKITATGLDYTSCDAQLSLTIENHTGEHLSFRSGALTYSCNSVNGYMFGGGYLNADIPAGKSQMKPSPSAPASWPPWGLRTSPTWKSALIPAAASSWSPRR